MPLSLTEIGRKYGTDKVEPTHTHFNKNYMNIYEQYFESMRNEPIHFLEIGILNGSSLCAWREYFPNAVIHAIDINPDCKKFECKEANVFVHILDCSDEVALTNFVEMFQGYFDVILDDGSHINKITIKTFRNFYNCLKPQSLYIIEDLACCYIGSDLPDHLKHWPGTERIINKEYSNNIQDMFDLYSEIHTAIDFPKNQPLYNIEYMHHYPFIILFKRNDFYKKK